jgi:exonuclease III
MAEMAGFHGDVAVLQETKAEEDEMGNWLAGYVPIMVTQFVQAA